MIIIGAKGFAKELLEIIYSNNSDEPLVFFDDISKDLSKLLFNKYPVISDKAEIEHYIKTFDNRYALGLGNPVLRYKMYRIFDSIGGKLTSVYSKTAIIGKFENVIGTGVNILNNVVIESGNKIGNACLIHNAAFISHDVTVGQFCEISPSVNLLGGVSVGNFCSIGTNALILPKVNIGNNVIVAAGSVVTKDVPDNVMVAGAPAVVKKELTALKIG